MKNKLKVLQKASRAKDVALSGLLFITVSLLVTASIINLASVTPTHALTYQSETDLTFTFNPTLTLTVSGDNNGDLIIPNLAPGSALDSNIIDVTAGSNSSAGYTLSATVGSSANATTNLTSSSNGTFTSTTSNVPTLTSFTDDTWGYSYCFTTNDCSTSSSTDWISGATGATVAGYNALPLYTLAGVKLVDTTVAGNTSLKFKIGAKASATKATGTYTNKINFTTIAKVITTNYTINYNTNVGNTGDTVTGMPTTPQTGTSTNGIVTFPTNKPVRENYIFKGWCDSATSDDTCPGIVTQPGGAYALNTTEPSTSVINMYAMWKSNVSEVTLADATNMQGFATADYCTGSAIGDTATLIDTRDDQSYSVTKLADGKCWMTTNLNIAGGTELSSDDTDFESTYTLPTTNGWTTSDGKLVLPASSTSGFSTDNYAYVYNTGNETSTCTSPGCYSYYSWDAATLGSGRSISTDNTDAPYSICPKGWHLPNTYNGSGTAAEATDFRALMIALGGSNSVQSYTSSTTPTGATISSALQADPYNFLLGGNYYGGSFSSGGSSGVYWSATSFSSSTYARSLSFSSSLVYSANRSDRRRGFSVRCVFGE